MTVQLVRQIATKSNIMMCRCYLKNGKKHIASVRGVWTYKQKFKCIDAQKRLGP